MVFEKIPDSLAQGGVIVWRVDRLIEHVSEDRQHLFFQLAMLVVQLLELFFGGGGGALHTCNDLICEFHELMRLRERSIKHLQPFFTLKNATGDIICCDWVDFYTN